MGRKKLYTSQTEKQRASDARYREKHGARRSHGKRGQTFTKARKGFFVAWDGEGRDLDYKINLPATLTVARDNYFAPKDDLAGEGYEPTTNKHILTHFACYGEHIHASIYDSTALTTEQILHFIGENVEKFGSKAIHVSFSFSYDATQIMRDLSREDTIKAHSPDRAKLSDYGRYGSFLIKYRPRKELYIAELNNPFLPYKTLPSGKKVLDKKWSVTIWDVWGFFQSSFLKALKMWGIGTPEALEQIARGKEGRSDFRNWSFEDIDRYNKLELVLLVELMEKVRNATNALDLPLQRWDGAGAIAAALFKKELPKDYIKNIKLPPSVERAAYYAYAGGRSECVKFGTHNGQLYRYDINSAYPDAMRTIPDLASGQWVRRGYEKYFNNDTHMALNYTSIQPFALYEIEWTWRNNDDKTLPTTFLPFFHRDTSGTIYFPPFGRNWIWGVELQNALRYAPELRIRIQQSYEFYSYIHDNPQPFAFIERYYNERLVIKRRIKEGTANPDDNGRSLIIKLGLNSLYGKTVQKVGIELMDDGSIHYPPYYNIVIGSYITAYTRAKLYAKAMQNPSGVCLFATDGIITTEILGDTETSETLGEWECERLDGLVLLQAGVYWTKSDQKWSEKSRGIDKAQTDVEVFDRMATVQFLWKEGEDSVPFSLKRFVTAKWSSLTEERYPLRGNWLSQLREIKLRDPGKKRTIKKEGKKPHRTLINTTPNWSVESWFNRPQMSEPRRIGGIDVDELGYDEGGDE